jgi:tripartite-type tricarboxylate transporter receptor subunit TctC
MKEENVIMYKKLSCTLAISIMIISVFACFASAAPTPPPGYPGRPINVIVPHVAGGGTDVGTRILLRYAEPLIGATMNVINIEGGGSEIGMTQIMNSPNDGYTIGAMVSASIMLTSQREAAYDPIEDFEPIALIVNDPRLLAFRADETRFSTLEELITYAKNNPGDIIIGTTGVGTTGHFSIMALNHYAEVDIGFAGFGGSGASRAALLGGHIDGAAMTVGEALQMVQEGQVKIVAMVSAERFPAFPDAQTFREVGIDLVINSARGFVAPRGTPREIIDFLAECIRLATEHPDFIRDMDNMGLPILFMGPDEYAALIAEEKATFDVLSAILE